jgi:hypothetical protein
VTSTGSYRVSIVVDRSRFPKLFRFVEWRIDVQLAEVRELLRLPMPELGLESGQTFAAAASLVNLIAGASVWFYDASTAGLSDRESGRRFRETLAAYWPWDDGEIVDKAEGIRLLYECLRNPLAHGFGMSRLDDESSPIAFLKDSLTAERVAELDLAEARPQGIGPTFRPAGAGAPARAYLVAVPALYWGVQRLLRAVLTDEHQLPAAEELAHALLRHLSASRTLGDAAHSSPQLLQGLRAHNVWDESRVDRDLERGRAVAARLKELGVKGTLIKAAEQGYITQLACMMPECFCPEELGGACYFEPVTNDWSDWRTDWMPTLEHFPVSKKDGGKATVDNAILAHRLCNRLDHSIRVGRSHARDLERISKAREKAIRGNNVQVGNTAEPEAEAATPKPKKTKRAPEWKSLPDAEKAQYLLDHQTLSDRTWTNEPRLKGEKRDAFIRRILLG